MLVIEGSDLFISNSTRIKKHALKAALPRLGERTSTRDYQRTKVYRADKAFESSLLKADNFISFIQAMPAVSLEGAVGGYINHIACQKEFCRLFGSFCVAVEIRRSMSRSWATKRKMLIGAKSGVVSRVDVLHEMSHCIVPQNQPPHGKIFASVFLALISLEYDPTVLQEQYIRLGVNFDDI